MKKLLSLLATITLLATSTTSLVACNTTQEYTYKELKKIKENNNINTKDGILEWIAPQEKPFKEQDNKWYIVVWCPDKNDDWRIAKFNNSKYDVIEIDKFNRDKLITDWKYLTRTLCIKWSSIISSITNPEFFWEDDDGTYFKSVYRWNNDSEPNTPFISPKTGKIKVEDK